MANVNRALRILDTWAKELERLGFTFAVSNDKKSLEARKDGEKFAFREGYTKREFAPEVSKARQATHKYPYDYEWVGSNKFTFTVMGPIYRTHRQWSDSHRTPLESRMPEMLADMVELVPLAKTLLAARAEEERVRAEQERRRWEETRRREEEKAQLDKVVGAEEQLQRAMAALRYVDRLEAELLSTGEQVPEPIAHWFKRVREIANETNPVAQWVQELREMAVKNPRPPDRAE